MFCLTASYRTFQCLVRSNLLNVWNVRRKFQEVWMSGKLKLVRLMDLWNHESLTICLSPLQCVAHWHAPSSLTTVQGLFPTAFLDSNCDFHFWWSLEKSGAGRALPFLEPLLEAVEPTGILLEQEENTNNCFYYTTESETCSKLQSYLLN